MKLVMAIEQLTGQLALRLHWQPGRVVAVDLQAKRLRLNSRLFAGKPVVDAPPLIGLLFSLCGTAQSIAAARAAAQALGQRCDPQHSQQQDWQIHSEMLFEHLLRLSQDWQIACAQPPLAVHDLQALFKLNVVYTKLLIQFYFSRYAHGWKRTCRVYRCNAG